MSRHWQIPAIELKEVSPNHSRFEDMPTLATGVRVRVNSRNTHISIRFLDSDYVVAMGPDAAEQLVQELRATIDQLRRDQADAEADA